MKRNSDKNNKWQRMGNGCNRWFIRLFKIHDLPVFMLLVLVTAFLCVIGFPVAATVETQHITSLRMSIQNPTAQTQDLLQQGKMLYEAEQFAEAVKVWVLSQVLQALALRRSSNQPEILTGSQQSLPQGRKQDK